MTRPRKRLIALCVLGALAAIEPAALAPWIDTVRFAIAEAISWPVRAVLSPIFARRKIPADDEAKAALALFQRERGVIDPGGETVFGAPVVGLADDGTSLVVLAGRASGVERGAIVASGDICVGFVDRTEEHTSRVRLLSHPSCRFSGEISGRTRADGSVVTLRVLLRGVRHRLAETQEGTVLAPELEGSTIRTIAATGVPAGLAIGDVHFAERLGNLGVSLAADPATIDQVSIYSADGTGRLPITDVDRFDDVPGTVSLVGDPTPGRRSVMVSLGTRHGVEVGAWMMRDGRILGRVVRAGRWECRVEPPLPKRGIPAIALQSIEGEPHVRVRRTRWPEAAGDGEGSLYFARASEDAAPRGAFLEKGCDRTPVLERFAALRPGDVVVLSVARHADEIRTLLGRARK